MGINIPPLHGLRYGKTTQFKLGLGNALLAFAAKANRTRRTFVVKVFASNGPVDVVIVPGRPSSAPKVTSDE